MEIAPGMGSVAAATQFVDGAILVSNAPSGGSNPGTGDVIEGRVWTLSRYSAGGRFMNAISGLRGSSKAAVPRGQFRRTPLRRTAGSGGWSEPVASTELGSHGIGFARHRFVPCLLLLRILGDSLIAHETEACDDA